MTFHKKYTTFLLHFHLFHSFYRLTAHKDPLSGLMKDVFAHLRVVLCCGKDGLRMSPWQSLKPGAKIFFVGIGGISMSGLSEIARADGYQVAGSDQNPGLRTGHLTDQGIHVFSGHRADWIDQFEPDLVVHTAAVPQDNPELIQARKQAIPVVDRARFLGWLNRSYQSVINIAGTHGKTTTTALCALMLIEAGLDPAVHLGAELKQFQGTVRTSQTKALMLSEACEYQNSFLHFDSSTAAILNIDYDHVDSFSNLDAVIDAFTRFASKVLPGGALIIPDDDPNVQTMLARLRQERAAAGQPMPRLVTFGISADHEKTKARPDYAACNLQHLAGLPVFDLCHKDSRLRVHLRLPGRHHVIDALAAVACAHENGVSLETALSVLQTFQGAEGRFTDIGHYRGARVVADYAHHPAAAKATLSAAELIPHQKLWVVFQPLTFSRTQVLFNDYVAALKPYPVVFSEIYSDREKNPDPVSSRMLAERINALGGQATFAENFDRIRDWIDQRVQPGDLLLVLGPENIRDFADRLTGRTSHLDG